MKKRKSEKEKKGKREKVKDTKSKRERKTNSERHDPFKSDSCIIFLLSLFLKYICLRGWSNFFWGGVSWKMWVNLHGGMDHPPPETETLFCSVENFVTATGNNFHIRKMYWLLIFSQYFFSIFSCRRKWSSWYDVNSIKSFYILSYNYMYVNYSTTQRRPLLFCFLIKTKMSAVCRSARWNIW